MAARSQAEATAAGLSQEGWLGTGQAEAAKARAKRRPPPIEYGILLTATLCLLAGGAVMVYSASSARDLLSGSGDGTGYLERYLFYGAIGLLAMRFLR